MTSRRLLVHALLLAAMTIPAAAEDAPVISALTPPLVIAGTGPFTLRVNGTNFTGAAVVNWNSTPLTTLYVNSNELHAGVPAELVLAAGTPSIRVFQGGQASNSVPLTIEAPPKITALSPPSVTEGGPAFTLEIIGSGFVSGNTVLWGGRMLWPTFIDSSHLQVPVPAALIASTGSVGISVVGNHATSAEFRFQVTASTSTDPKILSVTPDVIALGSAAFSLTVNGVNFTPAAVVYWNSLALTTTWVSATKLTAAVPATLLLSIGAVQISVQQGSLSAGTVGIYVGGTPSGRPYLDRVSPDHPAAGAGPLTITLTGGNFSTGCGVLWNGTALSTTFISLTELRATVTAALLMRAGYAEAMVACPAGTSNSEQIIIESPMIISGLTPWGVTAASKGFVMRVEGSGFQPGMNVYWNDQPLETTFVSGGLLTAPVSAGLLATPGQARVSVGTATVRTTDRIFFLFTALTIQSLDPPYAVAGGPGFTLTVTGTGFAPESRVLWNGQRLPGGAQAGDRLVVAVAPELIAEPGVAQLVVTSLNVENDPVPYYIVVEPKISNVDRTRAAQGSSDLTLTVQGSGFTNRSVVMWDSTPLATTLVSSTELRAVAPAGLLAKVGSAKLTVRNDVVSSNAVTFEVIVRPVIEWVSPARVWVGLDDAVLTVHGAGFAKTAVVLWDGKPLPTRFIDEGELTAVVSSTQMPSRSEAMVAVSAGGAESDTVAVLIQWRQTISALAPAAVKAGAGETSLEVTGRGFVTGAVVRWNGQPLATTFISSTKMTVRVPAELLTAAGVAKLQVLGVDRSLSPEVSFPVLPAVSALPRLGKLEPGATPADVVRATVELASPTDVELHGVLELHLHSDNTDLPESYMDPAAQFLNGQRLAPFTIPAGATEAVLDGGNNLQPGTVAGELQLVLTRLRMGEWDLPVDEKAVATLTIPRSAPFVVANTVHFEPGASAGIEVEFSGVSTTRELKSATFTFDAGPTGKAAPITVDLSAAASAWFASDEGLASGGLFHLRLPLTPGAVVKELRSVTVTVENTIGTSSAATTR